jgi:hypothetical protein
MILGIMIDPVIPFGDWFPAAAWGYGKVVLLLFSAGLAICYAIAVVRHGPTEAIYIISRAVTGFFSRDGVRISPRRVFALTRLAIKESLRRRVLVVFGVFVLIMLFAGWMLDVENDHPARLYLGFVLTMSNYLVLALAMFLSAFSLPNDIKNRTIYTITTKPVRPLEIFWGRVLGFITVGTLMLVAMGLVSGVFVYRGLHHDHQAEATSVQLDSDAHVKQHDGETSRDSHHRHEFFVDEPVDGVLNDESDDAPIGFGTTDPIVREHRHPVTLQRDGTMVIGAPQGSLQARVPIYGTLKFRNRQGQEEDVGLNVGKESTYRSYIEGNTLGAAVWTFKDISPQQFSEGLLLEMDIRVFRTSKGKIEEQIPGEIILRNPNPGNADPARQQCMPIPFKATEFAISDVFIGLEELTFQDIDGQLKKLDLFEDLVDENGQLEIWIRCREHAQFFGMAQADVYLKAPNNSFWKNFAKCYLGLWMQMVLVVLFGVFFSTFLTGIVALMATLATIVLGMSSVFLTDIETGEIAGGGPFESFYRITTQQGATGELEGREAQSTVIKGSDKVSMRVMIWISELMPNYREYNTVKYVAYGYDIDRHIIARHAMITFGYFLVLSVMGYFVLRTREFAA